MDYEILEKLKENQFPEISDGSIYPVLLRLSKKGYVHTTTRKSDNVDLSGSIIRFLKVDKKS